MTNKEEFNTSSLFYLAIKWRWHLMVVALLSGVAATVFSSATFIQPKFKSYAVVYPVNIIPYSNESATEQLLQLFQSADVKANVIEKYDLANHYGIGSNSKEPSSDLILEINDNFSISKTEFESVSIEILDKDPKMARDLVNELISQTNLKARQLQREKSQEMQQMYTMQLDKSKSDIDTLNARISDLRIANNVIDVMYQTKEITRGVIASKGGEAEKLATGLKEKGAQLTELNSKLETELLYYAKIKEAFDNVNADLKKELTYTNVVTRPVIADKKSYPIRWIIVLSAIVASLFLAFVIISFKENKKKNSNQSH